jgi:hypothetical protein
MIFITLKPSFSIFQRVLPQATISATLCWRREGL